MYLFQPQGSTRLLIIFFLWLGSLLCFSQSRLVPSSDPGILKPPLALSLRQVADDGLLLNQGWRFQAGDNSNGANPTLNDRQWESIDPARDIRDLPLLQQAGVGWLRLHIRSGPNLPPVMLYLFQSVASEVYLDGRLLYHFGQVSIHPNQVIAYNPAAAYNLPLRPSADHLLALRFACQPKLDFNKRYLNWGAPAVEARLFSASTLPAIRPVTLQAAYSDTFKVGIAFILFILHLSLVFAHRTQVANAYATGMYLLLGTTFLARAIDNFAHSTNLRMSLYYGSLLDLAVPAMALLTFYTLFNFRKGWLCWLAIGSVGLRLVPLPPEYQWLSVGIGYYMQFELIRLSLVAIRRRLIGAYIVAIGACINLGLWVTSSFLIALSIPVGGNEVFYSLFFLATFLCFPLTLSLRLALEHGWINQQLEVRLQEIEILSAHNLAQQLDRQQLLIRQNEYLEQQVAQRTQVLNQQANQLRELDQVKSRFVTNLTHEFRTPLSLISSPVEKLLQENRFDRTLLTLVKRNADQLLRLINQLMDLSKLEANQMSISLRSGNVTDFIRHLASLFRQAAHEQGITLTIEPGNVPDQDYLFDTGKWETILINLLANALKFTPSGGQVALVAKPVWAGDRLISVDLQLTDSGIGISPEALPHIFDRFYQADTSMTRAYDGSGIGLALVHELVSLLKGTITVESQMGIGTTFRLTLPVAPPATIATRRLVNWSTPVGDTVIVLPPGLLANLSSRKNEIVADETRPTILVVEDNDALRAYIVDELLPSYRVLQAIDGKAGWQLTRTELPNVVLTDVMMPRMDGYELTRLIKGDADTNHIAVVMLTAKATQLSRIVGLQQGADEYLSKPFSLVELQLRLQNLISRQQKLAEYYRQQFALSTVLPEPIVAKALTDPFLLRIYTLLDLHLNDPALNVDWLADQLAMDRKTLYRKVQHVIQLAPIELIRQYRLRKAADLLTLGHSIADTADLAGFGTPSYFSRLFREFYGQTPSEFIASQTKQLG